jgi:phosphohistidine phosphatase
MGRELILMRHGKSDWDQQVEDFQRPLKERGKRGAEQLGQWLLQQAWLPDQVVSSPAQRAIHTAQMAVQAMGMDNRRIVQERRIYAARVEDLLQVLAEVPAEAQRVLLVGHNPGFEDLTEYLVGENIPLPKDGKLLPTASIAHLQMPDVWQDLPAGVGKLLGITRASSLPKKFPFPGPQGKALRERPAYYYRQTGVIPYRVNDGNLEILLVMSNKRRHWILPKGIIDPQFSPQEAAAKEALEEAGVEGQVGEQSLGSYQYEKWGGECSVEVFPMAVEQELSEEAWQEHHRGREWMSPKQAGKRLKQPELLAMIRQLIAQLEQSGTITA